MHLTLLVCPVLLLMCLHETLPPCVLGYDMKFILCHCSVCVCVCLHSVFLYGWLPLTYFFSHLFVIIVGLWACHAHADLLPVILVSVILCEIMCKGQRS